MEELKKLSNQDLHEATVNVFKQERSVGVVMIHHLKENDRRRLWAQMGYSSLFEYCTKLLGYSESQAYRRISALKLIREVPQVEEKILTGELNLTTIAQAQTFFSQEAKVQKRKIDADEKLSVLETIANKTQKETAIELAKLNPEILKRDRETPIGENQTYIQYTSDNELKRKLSRLRELLGHQISPGGSHSELLHKISDIALEKLEPKLPKVKRDASSNRLSIAPKLPVRRRKYISVETKRTVWHRDGGRCTYRDPFNGMRCACRSPLEFDHLIPIAKGGDNSVENLRLLCRAHNQLAAIQEFGADKMRRFVSGIG
jgi:hypothetical protein